MFLIELLTVKLHEEEWKTCWVDGYRIELRMFRPCINCVLSKQYTRAT